MKVRLRGTDEFRSAIKNSRKKLWNFSNCMICRFPYHFIFVNEEILYADFSCCCTPSELIHVDPKSGYVCNDKYRNASPCFLTSWDVVQKTYGLERNPKTQKSHDEFFGFNFIE